MRGESVVLVGVVSSLGVLSLMVYLDPYMAFEKQFGIVFRCIIIIVQYFFALYFSVKLDSEKSFLVHSHFHGNSSPNQVD